MSVVPGMLRDGVSRQGERVQAPHQADMASDSGGGGVELPGALAQKYPADGRTLPWQWLRKENLRWIASLSAQLCYIVFRVAAHKN